MVQGLFNNLMIAKKMPSTRQCCSCGLGIEAVAPDTGSLLYTICFDGPSEWRYDQWMFRHSKRLAAGLYPPVPLYAAFLAEHSALEAGG